MSMVSMIGLDIAKNVFHPHGVDDRGRSLFSRKTGRAKLLDFFAGQARCVVALEACGGAYHWAREFSIPDVSPAPPRIGVTADQ